jgi:hypothetical protein
VRFSSARGKEASAAKHCLCFFVEPDSVRRMPPSVADQFKQRCYLVYALAPSSIAASEANDAVNSYIEDQTRGIVVFHDHFTGSSPHGGVAVFDVRSEEQLAMLDDPGPLDGWRLNIHALTFALSAVGFAEQADLTLREYAKTTLDALRQDELQDPRFWWQRRSTQR